MNQALRQAVIACPELLHCLELEPLERAALGFEIMLASSRDDRGHFYSPNGAPCPHGGASKNKQVKKSKKLTLPQGFKPVAIRDVYKRIGDKNSESVTGSDGKPSKFSQGGINHFKGKGFEKIKRLQSLDVAQDTVKTGLHYLSYIPGTKSIQTDFIKDYGNQFFYTARRNDTGEVYSWHELEEWQFNKKMKAYKNYHATGKIQ